MDWRVDAGVALAAAIEGDIDTAAVHVMDWGRSEMTQGCLFWIDTFLRTSPRARQFADLPATDGLEAEQVWALQLVSARARMAFEDAEKIFAIRLPAAGCLAALLTLIGTQLRGQCNPDLFR
ncbi:hypothetical protein OG225_41540 (plasmid) [Nocardia sp. NBC_01377]|uniref:hypothetical protein n=1 Tax=Nocardia sp. NBC_01377 TaxID=2903595 RepID=UPI00324CE012